MKVKLIKPSSITNDDIELYKEKTSKLKGVAFTSNDINLDKRIVSIRLMGDSDLILVNPRIIKTSDNLVVYFERDSLKPTKVRKTVRNAHIIIDTDNLGQVEFKPFSENKNRTWGYMSQEFLKSLVSELELLNKEVNDSIDEYFKQS